MTPRPAAPAGAEITLDDKYALAKGRVFLTGVQALTRLPMLQKERDLAAGLNTAGYVSGYRGSPLGGLDTAMQAAQGHLEAHDVRFHPAVNEDLAATAIWGTQQLGLLPDPKREGIFSMWYGKGPGVDRCGDVFKHANNAGTARHGGVLVVAGDDHVARSSATAHQSEHMFSACAMPVLAPAGVQDILDYGLHGWAMSRYTGCWVALKLSSDVVESSAVVDIDETRVQVRIPDDFALPADGLNIRWPDPQLAQERRMQSYKIYAAAAYARANGLNRIVYDSPNARLGLVACGKAWLELRQALHDLGIDEAEAARLGLRVYKVGMPWPLEAEGARSFARGLDEILVIEEKRQIIEYQLKEMLYDWPDSERPRVVGKFDESGEWPAPHAQWLLPPTGELTEDVVATAIRSRLAHLRHTAAPAGATVAALPVAPMQRMPYYCPGCPHNRSTRVPEGSCALAGVGCHLMAVGMERNTLTISQMGGEGVTWLGMAEHSGAPHVFANMGDGTYFHSGLLAIRAAVSAKVNITYKLLYNDAVAMTGGQQVDGQLSVPQMTRQLAAEGVRRIVVVADDVRKYARDVDFAPGVTLRPREQFDAVQEELRQEPGVTALVFDQTCATEARRRRKRGSMPAPDRHVFINEAVCEGCGDCAIQSNCLAVVPVPTEFGTKRRIDLDTCNFDMSCLEGRCPALVTVEGARLRRGQGFPTDDQGLPEPALPDLREPHAMLIAGVGGTGIVTIGALIGMAAHLEGKGVTLLDQTGLSQKGGAVLTHVRVARSPDELFAPRIAHADMLLGCDLLVAAAPDTLARLKPGHTQVLLNTAEVITGDLVRHPEKVFPREATLAMLRQTLGHTEEIDATRLASVLAGHSIATNMFMLGFAWQRGQVPVGRAALMRAVELNGVAVDDNRRAFIWGRRAAHDLDTVTQRVHEAEAVPASRILATTLDQIVARRRAALVDYQGEALARRYDAIVERVRRAEQEVAPGSERLTRVVAHQAYRLLAMKDEYEVARLFVDPAFDESLAAVFDGDYKVHYHLAPPWRRGRNGEAPSKRSYGPRTRHALRWLAAARALRGSIIDPFAWSAERRLGRTLLVEYELSLARMLRGLTASRLGAAAQIANWTDPVKGFGPVRKERAQAARVTLMSMLATYESAEQTQTPLAQVA